MLTMGNGAWAVPEVSDSPSTADRALLRSFRAWGGRDFDRSSGRFSEAWRDRLRTAWPSEARATPDRAEAELRRDHEASSRPDPSRIHASWFVRALNAESPAVRLAVARHAPSVLRAPLRRGLGIEVDDATDDRPADPDALGWALALWAERLVGDVPDREDDPPVIVALTRLAPRELSRLVKVCGLVKHAFATDGPGPSEFDEALVRFTPVDRVRLAFFRRYIGAPDARLVPPARHDLTAIEGDRRRGHARIGLLTFGRLLASAEPHRARWAMQHVPYPVARLMRSKQTPPLPRKALVSWESWVLEAARARLLAEGRLPADPASPSPAGDLP